MKAVAVCPEGKELRVEPSGRITLQEYLSELTAVAISAAEKASETSMRPPRTAASHAEGLHTEHGGHGEVLHVVVVVVVERTGMVVAQLAEIVIEGLHDQAPTMSGMATKVMR